MKHKGVGSIIGIMFLLLIASTGYNYYLVRNQATSRLESVENEMQEYEIQVNGEKLDILSVELTPSNGLNLTVENTGNAFSTLSWIGVEDLSKNSRKYYGLDIQISPKTNETSITNSSIMLDPDNEYLIQVLTKLGNIYYGEYPEPSTGSGGSRDSGGAAGTYYSAYETSDLHVDTAIGTHSLFGAMKAGPDEVVNTLSEESSGFGASNQSLVDNESFEGTWRPSGWTEVPGDSRWAREADVVYDGSWSADFEGRGGGRSGSLISSTLDCSDATLIYVTFWYYDDNLEAGEFELEYYDGSSWDLIVDLGTGTEDTWHNYQHNISDTQYQISNFQIRWVITSAGNGEHAYVDLVNVIKTATQQNFELDLEVQWSDLSSFNNEYLMVYGETQGTEALQVDVWDGVQWVTVINDIQTGWNTVDVSTYLTGSAFSIRFKDNVQTSDTTQDSWEIDALVLNLFD